MMFREKSISKYYTFALAAVFALTLAGCGGNGGGTADTTDPGSDGSGSDGSGDDGSGSYPAGDVRGGWRAV